MAAYASTVTFTVDKAKKVDSVTGIGLLVGSVNVTNYNSTNVAITDITGKFKTTLGVVAEVTDSGHILKWTGTSFKAYYADYDAVADGALIEVADDVDAGAANFIAVGLI